MNPIQYQELAMRTKDTKSDNKLRNIAEYNRFFINQNSGKMCSNSSLISAVLGISNESGELSRLIRKYVFQGEELDTDKIIKELGDFCWYITLCCDALGIKLTDVLENNIKRLKEKYPKGYQDIQVDNEDRDSSEYTGKEFVDQIFDSII